MTEAYPLQWPHGRPRKSPATRRDATFKRHGSRLSVADAIQRLKLEIARLGGGYLVISTDIRLRQDGFPRSDIKPDDPGVAVYFQLNDKPHCFPCDTYTRVADNIAAVAAHIESTRAQERHGVATVAEMFAGFIALPKQDGAEWWEVLKLPRTASRAEIEARYRDLARERHPDRGGSDHQMAELNGARAKALRDVAEAA